MISMRLPTVSPATATSPSHGDTFTILSAASLNGTASVIASTHASTSAGVSRQYDPSRSAATVNGARIERASCRFAKSGHGCSTGAASPAGVGSGAGSLTGGGSGSTRISVPVAATGGV